MVFFMSGTGQLSLLQVSGTGQAFFVTSINCSLIVKITWTLIK
jgi:hypothetical protein